MINVLSQLKLKHLAEGIFSWSISRVALKLPEDDMPVPHFARGTRGRAGLVSLASLLVSLESNRYVLTLGSNWSRLINELRATVVDYRCGNCTKMINLRDLNARLVNRYGIT